MVFYNFTMVFIRVANIFAICIAQIPITSINYIWFDNR